MVSEVRRLLLAGLQPKVADQKVGQGKTLGARALRSYSLLRARLEIAAGPYRTENAPSSVYPSCRARSPALWVFRGTRLARVGRTEKETEWLRFHAPQAPGNSHCAPTPDHIGEAPDGRIRRNQRTWTLSAGVRRLPKIRPAPHAIQAKHRTTENFIGRITISSSAASASEGSCSGLVDTRVDRTLSFEHGWGKVTERRVEPLLIVGPRRTPAASVISSMPPASSRRRSGAAARIRRSA